MTTVDLDGDDAADGVVALVVAVVELLVEALEREAVRRMESGDLSDAQVDRLGRRLAAIEEEVEGLKRDAEVEEGVADLRSQLDGLVRDAVDGLREPERAGGRRDVPDAETQGRRGPSEGTEGRDDG